MVERLHLSYQALQEYGASVLMTSAGVATRSGLSHQTTPTPIPLSPRSKGEIRDGPYRHILNN